MTAAAAIGGVREVDKQGAIGVIGSAAHQLYAVPLSKRSGI